MFIEVEIEEVVGSLDDLVSRLGDPQKQSAKGISLNGLSNSNGSVVRFGGGHDVLPRPDRILEDAGPRIIVVCSPESTADVALLWNLRSAFSDRFALPMGIPLEVASVDALRQVQQSAGFVQQRFARSGIYVTSSSVSIAELSAMLPAEGGFTACEPARLTHLGPAPSRQHVEVAVWEQGKSWIMPISPEDRRFFVEANASTSRLALRVDVEVPKFPFPSGDDIRFDTAYVNSYWNGALHRGLGNSLDESMEIEWPSGSLMLEAIAAERGLRVDASTAGIVTRTLLDSFESISELSLIAHAPLLDLLQRMANRQGVAWAKAHIRRSSELVLVPDGASGDPVAPTSEDLPQESFNGFREAIGSTKQARTWLDWAEGRRLIVKGFPIKCEHCGADQWTPVTGYSPPLSCRGCTRVIARPFPKNTLEFTYRLGESLRRVYEEDAIGHLLALRYFDDIFGHAGFRDSQIVGCHSGLDCYPATGDQRIGEADCLILHHTGVVTPIEVKKGFGGVTQSEIDKLDRLVSAWRSPWSAVVVADYARNSDPQFQSWEERDDGTPHRVLLTYDHLLEPFQMWSIGTDPFAWRSMTEEETAKRESEFGAWVVGTIEHRAESSLQSAIIDRNRGVEL